jgi:hypothetical protein
VRCVNITKKSGRIANCQQHLSSFIFCLHGLSSHSLNCVIKTFTIHDVLFSLTLWKFTKVFFLHRKTPARRSNSVSCFIFCCCYMNDIFEVFHWTSFFFSYLFSRFVMTHSHQDSTPEVSDKQKVILDVLFDNRVIEVRNLNS